MDLRTVDWTNAAESRRASEFILQQRFGVRVQFPANKLCPPIPNRENYINWLKYLSTIDFLGSPSLSAVHANDEIMVLDIGSGASCIYGILGVMKFGWSFVCAELDLTSIEWAQQHVFHAQNERLCAQISTIHSKSSDKIQQLIEDNMHKAKEGERRHVTWSEDFTLSTLLISQQHLDNNNLIGLRGPIRQALASSDNKSDSTAVVESEQEFIYHNIVNVNNSTSPSEAKDEEILPPAVVIHMSMCNPPFYDMFQQVRGQLLITQDYFLKFWL